MFSSGKSLSAPEHLSIKRFVFVFSLPGADRSPLSDWMGCDCHEFCSVVHTPVY